MVEIIKKMWTTILVLSIIGVLCNQEYFAFGVVMLGSIVMIVYANKIIGIVFPEPIEPKENEEPNLNVEVLTKEEVESQRRKAYDYLA